MLSNTHHSEFGYWVKNRDLCFLSVPKRVCLYLVLLHWLQHLYIELEYPNYFIIWETWKFIWFTSIRCIARWDLDLDLAIGVSRSFLLLLYQLESNHWLDTPNTLKILQLYIELSTIERTIRTWIYDCIRVGFLRCASLYICHLNVSLNRGWKELVEEEE